MPASVLWALTAGCQRFDLVGIEIDARIEQGHGAPVCVAGLMTAGQLMGEIAGVIGSRRHRSHTDSARSFGIVPRRCRVGRVGWGVHVDLAPWNVLRHPFWVDLAAVRSAPPRPNFPN